MLPSHTVRIELTGQPRFNAKPPSLTPKERRAFELWFEEATTKGWIRRSQARHSSSMFFVPKKDPSQPPRLVIDFRRVNAIIKSRIYAPRADASLRNSIAGHTWYMKLDLKDAFYRLQLHPPHRWITAFRTPYGLYEFNVLPMGLKNAPGEFQLYIEKVLAPVLGNNVCVHIDDILIHTDTRDQCVKIGRIVTQQLRDNGIPLNSDKSRDVDSKVDFCGFHYENHKCKPLDRSQDLRNWPEPRTQTELRAFLGVCNQLRNHVKRYAHIAQPLYSCTGKEWDWTISCRRAFQQLRRSCASAIDTHHHKENDPATLVTDASGYAIGAWLMQQGRVTAIWSRALTKAERNYTANERELLAVVDALQTWQYLIETAPLVEVLTDNMINVAEIQAKCHNKRVNRWIETLMGYSLQWGHIPGAENPADAVSRNPTYRALPEDK